MQHLELKVLFVALVACLASGQDASLQGKFSLSDITSRYYSNEELAEFMTDFTRGQCSSISRMFSIGKSVEGRELWVLEISNTAGKNDQKPNFKYVANMHGDEPGGRQLMIGLARWLCDEYQTNNKAKRIVEGMHMFLMPSMNPDGFASGPSRFNRNNKDLNRNFPDRIRDGLPLNASPFQEPETLAVMEWTLKGSFVASANLHAGALVANYPWDASVDGSAGIAASPDDKYFIHISSVYANSHTSMASSQEFSGGITNGNDWFTVLGGMQDWNYIAADCFEITLELSEEKNPPPSTLPQLWNDNLQALLNYATESVFGGISGYVVSAETKEPIVATISIDGIDKTISSRASFGQFNRPLAPGNYVVRVAAEGFQSAATKVTVPNELGKGVELNVRLSKLEQATTGANIKGDARRGLIRGLIFVG